MKRQRARRGVDVEAEHRTQDVEKGATRPSLGRARNRIQNWRTAAAPPKSAKQFRQAALVHRQRGVEQAIENRLDALLKSITR